MNHCMQPIIIYNTTILLIQLPKQVSQETQVQTLHTLYTKNHVSHSHITQMQAALALVQHNVACNGKQLCRHQTYRAAIRPAQILGARSPLHLNFSWQNSEFSSGILLQPLEPLPWIYPFNTFISFPPFICFNFLCPAYHNSCPHTPSKGCFHLTSSSRYQYPSIAVFSFLQAQSNWPLFIRRCFSCHLLTKMRKFLTQGIL